LHRFKTVPGRYGQTDDDSLNDVDDETLPRLPPISDLEDDILDVEDDVLKSAERTRSSRMRSIETCQSFAF
jgi:hypothetical protein